MLKLTTLLLDHNQLRDVPQALLDMKVVRISLDGNPLGSGMEHTIKYVLVLFAFKHTHTQTHTNTLTHTFANIMGTHSHT